MIAFFDTNIYIDYLKGIFPKKLYDRYFQEYIIRLCPVVYQELTRCVRSKKVLEAIEGLTKNVLFLPPPSNKMWIKTGQLSGKVIGTYDERSLEKIQNDLLIALTAHFHGATLITSDAHFKAIQRYVSFHLILHSK